MCGYVFPLVVKPDILTFWNKFDLEGHGQSPRKTIGILTKFGTNSVILAWTGDELSRRQLSNLELGKIWLLKLNLTLNVTVDCPPKQDCTFGPNLVILA